MRKYLSIVLLCTSAIALAQTTVLTGADTHSSGITVSYDNSCSSYPWTLSNGILSPSNSGVDSSDSYFTTTVSCDGAFEYSFTWDVSSEDSYDFLYYQVDSGTRTEISGSRSATDVKLSLSAGSHTIRFGYSKDGSEADGNDMGRIKKIKIYRDISQYMYFDDGISHSINNTSYTSSLSGKYEVTIFCDQNVECSFKTQSTGYAGRSITVDEDYHGWGMQINGRYCALQITPGTHTLKFDDWKADDTHGTWSTLQDLCFKKAIPDLNVCCTSAENVNYCFVNSLSSHPWTASGNVIKSGVTDASDKESFFYVTSSSTKARTYSFTLKTNGGTSDYFYYQIDDKEPVKYYGSQNRNISIVVNPLDHNVKLGYVRANGTNTSSYAEISGFNIAELIQDLSTVMDIENGLDLSVLNTANYPFYITDNSSLRCANEKNGMPGSYSSFYLTNNNSFPVQVDFDNTRTEHHQNYDQRGISINNTSYRLYGNATNDHKTVVLSASDKLTFFNSFNRQEVCGGFLELSNVKIKKLVTGDLKQAMSIDSGITLDIDNTSSYPWCLTDDNTAIQSCNGVWGTRTSLFTATLTSTDGATINFYADGSEISSVYAVVDGTSNTISKGSGQVYIPAGTHTVVFRNEKGSNPVTLQNITIKSGKPDLCSYVVADNGVTVTIENGAKDSEAWIVKNSKIQTGTNNGLSTLSFSISSPNDVLCIFDVKGYTQYQSYSIGDDTLYYSMDGRNVATIHDLNNYQSQASSLFVPAGSHSVDISFLKKNSSGYASIDTIFVKNISTDIAGMIGVVGDAEVVVENSKSAPWVAIDDYIRPTMTGMGSYNNPTHSTFTANIYVPKPCTMTFDWYNERYNEMYCKLNDEQVAQISAKNESEAVTINLKRGDNVVEFGYDENYYSNSNFRNGYVKNIKINSTEVDPTDFSSLFELADGVTLSFDTSGKWVNEKGRLYPVYEGGDNDSKFTVKINNIQPVIFSFDYEFPDDSNDLSICLYHEDNYVWSAATRTKQPKTHRRLYIPAGNHEVEFSHRVYYGYDNVENTGCISDCEFLSTTAVPDGTYSVGDYTFEMNNGIATLKEYSGEKNQYDGWSYSNVTMTLPEDFKGFDYQVGLSAICEQTLESGTSEWGYETTTTYYKPFANTYNVPASVYDLPIVAYSKSNTSDGGYYGSTTTYYNIKGIPNISSYGGSESLGSNYSGYAYICVPYYRLSYFQSQYYSGYSTYVLPIADFTIGDFNSTCAYSYIDEKQQDCVFVGLKTGHASQRPDTLHIPARVDEYYTGQHDVVELSSMYYGVINGYFGMDNPVAVVESKTPQCLAEDFSAEGFVFYVPASSYDLYKEAEGWKDLTLFRQASFYEDNFGYCVLSESDKTCEITTCTRDRYTNTPIYVPAEVTYSGTTYSIAQISSFELPDTVYMQGTVPPTIDADFVSKNLNKRFYVPSEAYDVYKNAEGWKDLRYLFRAPDFIVEGFGYAILSEEDCTCELSIYTGAATDIVVPATAFCDSNGKTYSVKRIGSYAFDTRRYYLTSVTLSEGIETISDNAFYYCSEITSVTMPTSVTSIGNSAFASCYSLADITIPNSVTSIGNEVFYYCSKLASVTIPTSVTSIGNCAFACCYSLADITIPNSVTSIGDRVFQNCI